MVSISVSARTRRLLSAELRQLGALAPGHAEHGAVSALDAAFAVFGVGITPDAVNHPIAPAQ